MTKPTYEQLARKVKVLEERVANHLQNDKALAESEEKFRLLYQRAPMGYQSLDERGHILEINQAWLDTLGYTRDEVIGKSFGDFLAPVWQKHFRENFPRFKAIGEILGIEFEMLRKDGSAILVSINGKIGKHPDGTFKQTHCILRDITEQKAMEERLRESEQRSQMLLENLPQKIFYKDSDSVYVACNEVFAGDLGISPEQIVGKTDYDYFPKELADKYRADDQRIMASGQVEIIEEEYQLPNGQKSYVQTVKKPILNKNGKAIALLGIFMDITEHKRAEEALIKEKNRAQKYLDIAGVMFAVLNPAGEITLLNKKGCEILKVPEDEALGKNWFDHFLPKRTVKAVKAVFTRLMAGDIEPVEYYENAVITSDGDERIIAFHNTVLRDQENTISGVLFSGEDITSRKKYEEELQRWWQVFKNAEWGIVVGSTDNTFELMNPAYARMHGYSTEELLQLGLTDVFAPSFHSELPETIRRCHEMGHYAFEADHIRKDGSVFPVYNDVTTVKDERGQVLYRIVSIQDITRRRQEEEELRLQGEIINRMSEGVYLLRMDGTIVYANPKFEQMFGYAPGEIIGRHVSIINATTERSPAETARDILKALERDGVWQGEVNNIKKDGTPFWCQASFIAFDHSKHGKALIAVHTDISKQKLAEKEKQKLETQLHQAQKMEAIGTMAGGIAHDFNNILMAIIGYAEMIRDEVPADNQAREDVGQILKAAERAVNLVKQILAYSRQAELALIPLLPHTIVKETMDLLRPTIPSTVAIHQSIDSRCGTILADPTKIHQVLMNLCSNAIYAMDEKGIIEIEMTQVELTSGDLADQPDMAPGPYMKLSVTDSGTGIDVATQQKMFDPFFTTKGPSKGTGMGLSVVHGIIKNHNGMITVDSTPGSGSTFTVFIPIIEREEELLTTEGKEILPLGTESILFVDDEEMLVRMGTRMLEQLGYRVTPRASSREALEVFESNPEGFDLVITDQTMPELSGVELTGEILKIRPEIPIILCTGFSSKISGEDFRKAGVREFIMKPYEKNNLAKIVRKALDGEA